MMCKKFTIIGKFLKSWSFKVLIIKIKDNGFELSLGYFVQNKKTFFKHNK